MIHSDAFISQAAAILAARRTAGEQGPRLPQVLQPSDIDHALAIQAAVAERAGARIGGWKCGMPADGRVTLAPVAAADVHAASPCAAWTRAGRVRVEPELAFILGRDLPPRERPYARAEVDAAIARTHLALELIDCRYDDADAAGFLEHLADGLFNQGLFLGPQVDGERARHCGTMAIRVTAGAAPRVELDGRHPAVDPRAPLYWLAEFLRGRGHGLQAGQAVITGSYVAAFDVPPAEEIAIHYGDLGELTVRFTPR